MITLTLEPGLIILLIGVLLGGIASLVLLLADVGKYLQRRSRQRRLESRLIDHDGECYGYYHHRRRELEDRIQKLETELARVPRAMRSRKTQKLVGK